MLECLFKGHLHVVLLAGKLSSGSQHESEAVQGRIQDFLKEGVPKLRTDRTAATVGAGGV